MLFRCIIIMIDVLWILISLTHVTPTDLWLSVWCIWHTKLEIVKIGMFTTDDDGLSGSTKCWIFKSMWNI